MIKFLAVLFVLAVVVAGCHIHSHGSYRGDDAVVIEPGHVHSADCGHYYYRGQWYHSPGHHHGAGCGHAYRDGLWIVVD